jgi:hypothetical protein
MRRDILPGSKRSFCWQWHPAPRVAERISFDEVAEAHRRLGRAVLRASLFCAGEAIVLPRSEMPTLVGSSTTEILPAES